MNDITTITQGCDFTLRIQAKRVGFKNYVKVSFEEISNITVNLISLPSDKTALSHSIDEYGRLVVPVDGTDLACNTYGLELLGFYNNGNWRQQIIPVVEIVKASLSDNYALTETDELTIDLDVTLGETYVSSRVFAGSLGQIQQEMQEAINQSQQSQQGSIDNISAAITAINSRIDGIIAGSANVSLSASPATVFVGVQTTVNLSASSDTEASAIAISGGSLASPVTGSGLSLSAQDSITPQAPGDTSYQAEFTISGTTKTVTTKVRAVHPIYTGAGDYAVAGNRNQVASPKTSPSGTYSITVPSNDTKVFFLVPSTMTIASATMDGFEFPLATAQSVTLNGISYKLYESANSLDAGTYSIKIS